MSEREELAALIGSKLDSIFGTREFGPATQDYQLADELIAAGYRKPRTITTVEELDALAEGSMILDGDPDVCSKNKSGTWKCLSDPEWSHDSEIVGGSLPATVLYEPEPKS